MGSMLLDFRLPNLECHHGLVTAMPGLGLGGRGAIMRSKFFRMAGEVV